MGELSPSDERKWWALQNRLGNVWSQIALAPIAVSLFEFAEGRYWFGAGYLLLGLVLAFVVNNLMKSEEIKPATDASPHSYRYIGVVAVILTWALCVFTIYAQLFLSSEARPNHVIGYVSDYSGRVVSGTRLAAATPRIESAFPQGASPASPLEGVRPFSAGNIQTLQLWMLDLPRPCRVKITAPPENQPLRLWLRDTAINGVENIGGRSDKVSPCTVVDDDRDMHPDWYGGQTFPEAGFIVHVTPSWSAVGEFLEAGLRQIQLKARHGQGLPSDSPYDLYLELGKGSP